MRKTKIFSGQSHPDLSAAIMERLGMPASSVSIREYPNHEISLHLGSSVRGHDVFLIQSGSANINDHLMELLIMIHSSKIASAARITAVIPYFPYGKWSKKKRARGSITAKLIANMLDVAGVDHIITMDLHSSQIQGFFRCPVDNLFAEPSIAKFIRDKIPAYKSGVVVSKNAGSVKKATSLADRLRIDFALVHRDNTQKQNDSSNSSDNSNNRLSALKYTRADLGSKSGDSISSDISRDTSLTQHTSDGMIFGKEGSLYGSVSHSRANSAAMEDGEDDDELEKNSAGGELVLVGDVYGRVAFILDDIIDGTRSLIDAASLLNREGAKDIYIVATHGILSENSLLSFEKCEFITGVIITNTYPISEENRELTTKLSIIDISGVFAEAIRRTHNGESVSYLFDTAVS